MNSQGIDVGEGTERFVPGQGTFAHSGEQHLLRYEWACTQLVNARKIVDVACGTGYGSHMLRTTLNADLVGCDLSQIAIDHATGIYGCEGLEFIRDDAQVLSHFEDECFDAAVSFETIEHLPDRRAYLAAVHRILKPGGRLLISTPDRRITSVLYPITGRPHCEHHLVEFTLKEFIALVTERFSIVEIFGQSYVPATLVALPVQIVLKAIAHKLLGKNGRRFLEKNYWRGTGTHVQPANEHKGMIANFNILSCTAK